MATSILPTSGVHKSTALAFLMERQDDDGAWRSETYGFLRDGASLTPSVAKAVLFGASGESSRGACDAALDYVASFVTTGGVVDAGPQGFHYPVYTAALAVTLLVRADDPQRQLAARSWEDCLRSFQLVETLGWSPTVPLDEGLAQTVDWFRSIDVDQYRPPTPRY